MRTRRNFEQKLADLHTRRDKIRARLAAIEAQIDKIERMREEREMREIVSLIKSRKLTVEQIRALSGSEQN